MNPSALFINRPVATSLLSLGLAFAGILGFYLLPVAPLPEVEYPTIVVQASMPGASPEVMASSIASPIERELTRIAGISDMTSGSSLGSTRIIIQFDLSRDINGAANDVQAALNAAQGNLPANLPANPTYRKVNPSDSPIMILGLTSDNYTIDEVYDFASNEIEQRVSQIDGVGQVTVGGSSLPAVRVEVNPNRLNHYGISLTDVQTVIANSNNDIAVGQIEDDKIIYDIDLNDQLFEAKDYKQLVIGNNNGEIIRLADVAQVANSVENIRNGGSLNGKPAVAVIIFKEPGANVIETVAKIKESLPILKSMIPESINIDVVMDRTTTIKASLHDVERTLIISMLLVIAVVYVFLGNVRVMLIPAIAMTLSLLGTFAVMKLLGFSLDNLSLMALTISTGFVVDDAIVVLENISRYIEKGLKPIEAALKGSKEIGFTVTSISISLIAVFIPILCMGGIVGRLLREFAITLSIAIIISLFVSITLTPMMCSRIITKFEGKPKIEWFTDLYKRSLQKALLHQNLVLFIALVTICLSITLFIVVPKGFFPQQDTGRIMGTIVTDQDTSFQALEKQFKEFINIIKQDPGIENVVGFIGSGSTNSGSVFITLKDLSVRKLSADMIISRLRGKLTRIAGATLYMQPAQDIVIGGRQGNAQFQYTISGNSINEVNKYAPQIMAQINKVKGVADINNDERDHGLQSYVEIDYDKAAAYGITAQAVDSTLYSAFGQSLASTMYSTMNQYYVVLEVAPKYWQNPESLKSIYVKASNGQLVPLSTFAKFSVSSTLLAVNHQGLAPSATLSFNLLPGVPLGNIVDLVSASIKELPLPATLEGSFRGTAQVFQTSLANEPYLILAALLTVYIVLGMLYENLIHPITIISTLPSAGVGALLALMITKTDLTIIAMIGIILLIGIVKKNAIMMIDFVIDIKKQRSISSEEAILQAAVLRFRPIMMTTMAAILGAIPLACEKGIGSELRNPLGVAIIGGLIFSQLLTLYSTPVIYLKMEKLANLLSKRRKTAHAQ